jgi:hypothetical protein
MFIEPQNLSLSYDSILRGLSRFSKERTALTGKTGTNQNDKQPSRDLLNPYPTFNTLKSSIDFSSGVINWNFPYEDSLFPGFIPSEPAKDQYCPSFSLEKQRNPLFLCGFH